MASTLMMQTIPSVCWASHDSIIEVDSDVRPCTTGMPLRRMEVGTLASGRTVRMIGSASVMISSGVR